MLLFREQAAEILDQWFKPLYDLVCLQWSAPLWMGEFSAAIGDNRSTGMLEYAEDMLALMDHYQLGWAWHAYGMDREGKSPNYLLDGNGFVRENLVRILDRVYPQSTSLPIEAFTYDPHHCEAVLTVAAQEKMLNVTIRLHVPSRFTDMQFLNGEAVRPDCDWNRSAQVLTVSLSLGEPVSVRLEFAEA